MATPAGRAGRQAGVRRADRGDDPGCVRPADPAARVVAGRGVERSGGVPARRGRRRAGRRRRRSCSLGAGQPVLASLLAVAVMAIADRRAASRRTGRHRRRARSRPIRPAAERARKDPAVGPGGVVGADPRARDGGRRARRHRVLGRRLARGGGPRRRHDRVADVAGPRGPGRRPVASRRDGFAGWFAARVGPSDAVVAVASPRRHGRRRRSPRVRRWSRRRRRRSGSSDSPSRRSIVALRGQLDGDGLGAIVELTLAAVLIVVAVAA